MEPSPPLPVPEKGKGNARGPDTSLTEGPTYFTPFNSYPYCCVNIRAREKIRTTNPPKKKLQAKRVNNQDINCRLGT